MSILAACRCGKKVQAKDELAGKKVKCPQCGEPLLIPSPGSAKPTPNPAAKPVPKPAPKPAAPQPALDPFAANDPFAALGSLPNAGGFGAPMGGPGMNPLTGNPAAGNPLMGGGMMGPGAYQQQYAGSSRDNSKLMLILGVGGGVLVLFIVMAFVVAGFMTGRGQPQPVALNDPPAPQTPAPVKQASAPAAITAPAETKPATITVNKPATTEPAAPAEESPATIPEPAPASEIGATGASNAGDSSGANDGANAPETLGADGRPAAPGGAKSSTPRPREGQVAVAKGKATTWQDVGKAYLARSAKPEPFKGATQAGKDEALILRYSWMFDILPYIGHQEIHAKFDRTKSWNDKSNLQLTLFVIPAFLNPQDKRQSFKGHDFGGMGVTHFVGMSGVEESRNDVAASWPRSDPRAGVFGYDGIAKPTEIVDGTSSTISIIGSGEMMAPWVIAGGATVRGARDPYFDDITGFGSKGVKQDGVQASFADGSVRLLNKKISPKVFKALCTIHGAETVDQAEVDAGTIK